MSVTDFFNGLAKCDHPAALTDFDGARYMGTWYEQTHVKGQFFQPDDSVCTTANYSDLQTSGHFVVDNKTQDSISSPPGGIIGDGYCPDASGQCYVTFYVAPKKPNYNVVETDYDSYSIVYSCGLTKSFLWLLTREPVVSDELYNYMLETAAAKLPNYDFNNLVDQEYQGDQCAYAQANYFLQ